MREIKGGISAQGMQIGIVVSRFNSLVTERLLQGALDWLERAGVEESKITVVRVPGSFEVPWAARQMAKKGNYDAIVCLGVLIRGETDHYDHLASAVTGAISQVALEYDVPVSFGVLTVETVDQALNRAGVKSGNKGAEAAAAAVEMAHVRRAFSS